MVMGILFEYVRYIMEIQLQYWLILIIITLLYTRIIMNISIKMHEF